MRDKILKKLADWHATYPWRMLVVVIILTVVLAGLSGQLTITMNMKDLLPSGDPKVDQFNEIIDDFSIHLISGFTEWRAAGDNILGALEKTFLKSGKGIITGALTTACAFLALLVSQSRGMKEMEIVAGVGLLSILVATFLFLPVMLVFRGRFIDRRREITLKFVKQDISFRSLGRFGEWMSKHYAFTIISSIIISAFLSIIC